MSAPRWDDEHPLHFRGTQKAAHPDNQWAALLRPTTISAAVLDRDAQLRAEHAAQAAARRADENAWKDLP